jgi:transposase
MLPPALCYTKHHLLTDRNGVPLAAVLTAANVHDSKVIEGLVDAVEPIKRPGRGRPRKRPEKLHADKAYDFRRCRAVLRRRGIKSRIARRGKGRKREVGPVPVGGGAHAGVAGTVPQALGALREASGHPRGVPSPRMRAHLPYADVTT